MNPFSMQGKTAIVTGSSRGIGRAIAIAYARAGARVVVTSRKADACEAVVREIEAEGGPCGRRRLQHLEQGTDRRARRAH